jgi:CDGSH-type Zn-finger protein
MSQDDAVTPASVTVAVTEDGPYLVTGPVTVAYQVIATDDEGASWTWKQGATVPTRAKLLLCRCGRSSTKPFCDDTHASVGFDGTETASRTAHEEQAVVTEGPTMDLADAEALCAFARFCDGHGKVWDAVGATTTDAARRITAHEASHCPGGRLVAYDKVDGARAVEPQLEVSIGLVEDPVESSSGGIWLRGGIAVTAADGTPYPVRNRVVLCRCGASSNKPFCDGSHATVGFADAVLETVDAEPDGTDSVTTPRVQPTAQSGWAGTPAGALRNPASIRIA